MQCFRCSSGVDIQYIYRLPSHLGASLPRSALQPVADAGMTRLIMTCGTGATQDKLAEQFDQFPRRRTNSEYPF